MVTSRSTRSVLPDIPRIPGDCGAQDRPFRRLSRHSSDSGSLREEDRPFGRLKLDVQVVARRFVCDYMSPFILRQPIYIMSTDMCQPPGLLERFSVFLRRAVTQFGWRLTVPAAKSSDRPPQSA